MEELSQKVYEKAVKLLTVRMHTVGEMHQKLKAKGFKDSDIRPVLRRLEEQKFLDDLKFAEIFVDNLKRYKDFGYYGIKAKLLQRKIPSDMAEQALQEFLTGEDEFSIANRVVGKLKRLDRKSWEEVARSLKAKGFRGEILGRVLRGHFP